MIIPVQCKTCGKCIMNLYPAYVEKVKELDRLKEEENKEKTEEEKFIDQVQLSNLFEEKESMKKVLDSFDIRDCCVLMIMTHVDLVQHI